MMKLREKRVHRPRTEDLRGVKADIFRVSGLRADFERLSDQEAVELRALLHNEPASVGKYSSIAATRFSTCATTTAPSSYLMCS
jgi:hypothetical protein